MSDVKRWEPENTFLGYNMKPKDDGSFVLYEHYQKDVTQLQADVEQWKLAHRLAMQDNIKLQFKLDEDKQVISGMTKQYTDVSEYLQTEVERLRGISDNYCSLLMDANSELQRIKMINDDNFKLVLDQLFELNGAKAELTKARELIAAQEKVIEWAMIIDKQAFAKGTRNVGVAAFRTMGDALVDLRASRQG